MGCNDDVTVYQVALEKSSCCANGELLSCPADIAANLLVRNQESHELQLVAPGVFEPWFESRELIPLTFKLQPPKLSVNSEVKSNSSLGSETKGLLIDDNLSEFCPVYSGNSFLKNRHWKHSHQSTSSKDCNATKPFELREQGHEHSSLLNLSENNQGEKKSPQATTKHFDKALWCTSPPCSSSNKKKDLMLGKLKEINLQQVKSRHCLSHHQRGKWVISEKTRVLKGKGPVIELCWKRVCSLIKEGFLPHCNAKFQKTTQEVWLYCDFGHSLKVRSILENGLGNLGTFTFYVHPMGVVMEL